MKFVKTHVQFPLLTYTKIWTTIDIILTGHLLTLIYVYISCI